MKKLLSILMIFAVSLTLVSCSSKKDESNSPKTDENTAVEESPAENSGTEDTSAAEQGSENNDESGSEFEPLEIQEEYDVSEDIGDDDGLEGAIG